MRKEQIFRFKPKDRQTMILWLVLMGFWLFWSIAMASIWLISICGFLVLVCAVYLARSFYDKIIIADTKISVTHYFRTQEIAWNDISYLEPRWTGFLLSNSGRDTQIFISAEIINLWKFIAIVDRQRRALLQPTKTTFHENPIAAWLIGLAGAFIAYYSAAQLMASSLNLLPKIVVLSIGLGFVLLAVFTLKRFSFEDDRLVVRTLGRERIISWEGIDVGSISNEHLLIISREHKSVSVDHLVEGMPSFMITLKTWLRSHRSHDPETIEDVPAEEPA